MPFNTIKSLKLNMEAAMRGETWNLLPDCVAGMSKARQYPLPSSKDDLQRVATIVIPENKMDSGVLYIKRCRDAYKKKELKNASAVNDIAYRKHKVEEAEKRFDKRLRKLELEAKMAVQVVRDRAMEASASLKDLFALKKRGLRGMMEAHIEGKQWQGERVSQSIFLNCCGKVAQALKAFGLPSDPRDKTQEAVFEELASALRDTQEAVELAPGSDKTEQ